MQVGAATMIAALSSGATRIAGAKASVAWPEPLAVISAVAIFSSRPPAAVSKAK